MTAVVLVRRALEWPMKLAICAADGARVVAPEREA
jgi:hypothetical protein